MNIDLDSATVKLERGHTLQLGDARGSVIVVSWGMVWVTQPGDRQDYILDEGETFTIGARGVTLVHALRDAGLSVLEPGTRHKPRAVQSKAIIAGAARRSLNSFEWKQLQREARRRRAEHVNKVLAIAMRAVTRAYRWLAEPVAARRSIRAVGSLRTNINRT